MNRLGKVLGGACVVLAFATAAEAADPSAAVQLQSPGPASDVARSGAIAGAALAISQLAIWRNNMPRVLQPGQPDPGSPMVVKAEIEAKGVKAATKLAWKAELIPAGGAAQPLKSLEVNVEGKPWTGDLKPGDATYIEFYSKDRGTLAPGTKAKLVITFNAGAETLKLESETTVEKVD